MTDVPLLTHIEALLAAQDRHHDALRTEDRRWLESRFEALDKALLLREKAYPTTADFNRMKEYVDEQVGGKKLADTVRNILVTLAALAALGVAIWAAYK